MTEIAADMWAYCDSCDRWFACPGWAQGDSLVPTCPVCTHEPSLIEDRALVAAQPPVTPSVA